MTSSSIASSQYLPEVPRVHRFGDGSSSDGSRTPSPALPPPTSPPPTSSSFLGHSTTVGSSEAVAVQIYQGSEEISNAEPESNEKNSAFDGKPQSYQIRALARKTLAYQKRQYLVNICCVALCPLIMVVVSFLLGFIVTLLIRKAGPANVFLTCSKVDATGSDGFPLTGVNSTLPSSLWSDIPNAPHDSDYVNHTNYYIVSGTTSATVGSGCVRWFEHNYPYRAPYEVDPGVKDPRMRMDTTFRPDPPGGWFGLSSLTFPAHLSQYQTFPWAYVLDLPGQESGTRPPISALSQNDILSLYNNPDYANVTPGVAGSPFPGDSSTGLLGAIDYNLYVNYTVSGNEQFALSGFVPVPYYVKINNGNTKDDMNALLTQKIMETVNSLSTVDKTALLNDSATQLQMLAFYANISDIVTKMPWGISPSTRQWNYTMQIGTDKRINLAASYPSQGFRRFAQQSMLSNAFLRSSNTTSYRNATITHGYRIMPSLYSTMVNLPIGSLAGRILYPFGVSFLLPIFVIALVKEKEERILVMMRMNGLKSYTYYLTHYIHFYILHILSTIVFIGSGLVCHMEFFTRTDPGVYILLFFIWGHTQNALAFFLAVLFNKNRTALVITFLIVLCGVIVNEALDFLFTDGAPAGYFIWPPFAFYRALSVINQQSVGTHPIAYRLSDLQGNNEVLSAFLYLTFEAFVLLALAAYLSAVLPSEFGVRRRWHFIFSDPYKAFVERDQKNVDSEIRELDEEEVQFEDIDVKAERERVLNEEHPYDSPLVMKRMRKVYGAGNKLAVKDVTLAVEPNIIFGLLGPNGAGKTTLISILTGLYEPSAGQARLAGFDISTEMSDVYRSIGVCPQHDILWDDLTVGEHLYFYARLKGVPPNREQQVVQQSLQTVSLVPFENRLSKGLSGGEKRRLSIAIALIADPSVVFLDEPTTGLDPEMRRLIWTIVNEAKQGRTIVLTTHSMEEAEVLCNRIGIMAKGTLRCIGNQLRLKEVYGRGFKLTFTCKPENTRRATA
ncbi:hypothetical protein BC936DRAFT_143659 [Jimgerdemannia flammicorona]|uniref:ABC transporter domain-containing protein n=1 Tax=Jimgerdemannia flammicorona TaxID=994334 RepID=A0A433DDL7_9FUNG|nr:hypothetical protein BC936DRAFT_143659 [Jimgerdemannia flammicorona]